MHFVEHLVSIIVFFPNPKIPLQIRAQIGAIPHQSGPLSPLSSLSRSRRARERSFGRAVYRCQGAELLWPCRHVRSFGGDHPAAQLAQRRTLPLHLSRLPLLEATTPSRSTRSHVLARASARRVPWPTMDGADARLEPHCFPRPPDHLSRTYDLPRPHGHAVATLADRKSVV